MCCCAMCQASSEERGRETMKDVPQNTTDRAATDEQKRAVIEQVYTLWCAHPELRLGQLLANVSSDLYYKEDFPLVETLEHFYAAHP